MGRVGGGHHRLGVKHLGGQVGDRGRLVGLASGCDEGRVSGHEEVETGERDHVDGQLSEVRVELSGESEGGRDTGHHPGDWV